ncbi:cytochrome P450 [Diplogelasinospora grovesii]|uniref:Cytochrome P450 n=1 Tax=Diplogelasinospora grovesii TaxID=303347 RepID=A0AAN6NEA5_9PEZI|nr:cytochrome P450 [Diplogelasinospora grovesii]
MSYSNLQQAILDLLDRPAVILILATSSILVIIYVLYYLLLLRPSSKLLPNNLPIVGAKPGEWFPLLRATWRNTLDMKTATEIAYQQYSDRACFLPMAGAQLFVHLPHKELQWFVERPEAEVSVREQTVDSLQFNHTIMDPDLAHKPAHIAVVSGPLTRDISSLIPPLLDEIKSAVDTVWGVGSSMEVCVFDSMCRVVGQATNRVFIGLPFCRDARLLNAATSFSMDIPMAATLLQLFWAPLRPHLAPIITLPNRIHTNRFFHIVRPEIRRRLQGYGGGGGGGGAGEKGLRHNNDFLQWSIDQAMGYQDPYYRKVDTLAGRVLLNNFTSIHTSSFAITHVILDLVASKREHIDELRDEVVAVLAKHNGEWNKRALADMVKMDSCLRESARLNSFVVTATNRKIVKPEGVTTPSGRCSTHLPKGTFVCGPSYPVLHDPAIYPDPYTFRPFRFAGGSGSSNQGEEGKGEARLDLTRTSVDYVPFGHGRHACAGRFFAASTLKMILGYILINYDFEMQEKRAENVWIAANRMPDMKATIRVKRRTGK